MPKIKRICKNCNKVFYVYPCIIKQGSAFCCSKKCSYELSKGKWVGSKNPAWKGKSISYKGLHDYINKYFGKAYKCENPNCKKHYKKFEWSLKKGRQYSRNRNDYWMLCVSCHRAYDKTKESKEKTSQTLKGHKAWNNWQSIKKDKLGKFAK